MSLRFVGGSDVGSTALFNWRPIAYTLTIVFMHIRLTKLSCLMTVAVALTPLTLWPQSETPEKFLSPNGKYVVQIVQKAMKGADSLDDFTLVIGMKSRTLTKVPTYGYLTAAHWSPDGKYVAVNNRRGNSGDYVWVFDLNTGKAIKSADDKNGEAWQKAAAEAVRKELPSANDNTLVRDWLTAQGWDSDGLKIVVRSIYRGTSDAFDWQAVVDPANWQVKSAKLERKPAED